MLFPQKVGFELLRFGLGVVFFPTSLYERFPGDWGKGREKRDLRGFIVWVIFPTAKCQHSTFDDSDMEKQSFYFRLCKGWERLMLSL